MIRCMAQGHGTMTTSEVADYFGVTAETIRRWTETGAIPCVKLPSGRRRFYRAQIEARAAELGLTEAASA